MKSAVKKIYYDKELKLEAYSLEGTVQSFPNHIHNYYVVGIVEEGGRILNCKNTEYLLWRGDVLLLSPDDNHGCSQKSKEAFIYKAINIPTEIMLSYLKEFNLDSKDFFFSENVIKDTEIYNWISLLHQKIMLGAEKFEKEEMLLMLISMLLERYGKKSDDLKEFNSEIEKACSFMQAEYKNHISLEDLCSVSSLSKSSLLRAFTKFKGITPYRYLQSVRINKAKGLLEKGISPAETAQFLGFADQSHFTRYFSNFIGVSPLQYKGIFENERGVLNEYK